MWRNNGSVTMAYRNGKHGVIRKRQSMANISCISNQHHGISEKWHGVSNNNNAAASIMKINVKK